MEKPCSRFHIKLLQSSINTSLGKMVYTFSVVKEQYNMLTEHFSLLKKGSDIWNAWRKKHPDTKLDLSGLDLSGLNLHKADLSQVKLCWTDLSKADLSWTDLKRAELVETDLSGAYLR